MKGKSYWNNVYFSRWVRNPDIVKALIDFLNSQKKEEGIYLLNQIMLSNEQLDFSIAPVSALRWLLYPAACARVIVVAAIPSQATAANVVVFVV